MKNLYVSDLDGTLLTTEATVSEYTAKVINNLVDKGLNFSYATARSLVTANKVANRINANLPVIIYNGTFIIDSKTKKFLVSNFFAQQETTYIYDYLLSNNTYPIVYSFIDDIEKYSYCNKYMSNGMAEFLNTRKNDVRDNPVNTLQQASQGRVFNFTCIDSEEKLKPIYDSLKDKFNCIYARDIYSNEQWLEILPVRANKSDAILELKKKLGCDKVIVFGDGKNDISMFKVADECYAVKNAVSELKDIATGIIDSNNDNGVAKWLLENAEI